MTKASFTSIILGIIGGIFGSVGMVLTLVPQFDLFIAGLVFGIIGLVILATIYPVYCKLAGKKFFTLDKTTILTSIYGLISFLVFGAGLSLALTQEIYLVHGIIVGSIGLFMLVGLTCIILRNQGVKFDLTKETFITIITGIVGFALLCVGVGIVLPSINEHVSVVGLTIGTIGIIVCAICPVVSIYKSNK